MDTPSPQASQESAIRQLIDDWATAIHSGDIERIMACYAPDVVAFDLPPPLQFVGAEAYRKDWESYLPAMNPSMKFEMRDLRIAAGADLAFAHYLSHFSGSEADGKPVDVWMRVTDCYRKVGARWLIAHEHMSVPIDMQDNKPLFDLKP